MQASPPTLELTLSDVPAESVALRRLWPGDTIVEAWPLIQDCLQRCFGEAADRGLEERVFLCIQGEQLKAFSIGGVTVEGKRVMLGVMLTQITYDPILLEVNVLVWAISDIRKFTIEQWQVAIQRLQALAADWGCSGAVAYFSDSY